MTRPLVRATLRTLVVAGLLTAIGSADPVAAPRPVPLGAAVAPDGTVLTVSCVDGWKVVVHLASPVAADREIALPGLPTDAKIVDVRVAPWLWREGHPTLALGLVVRREGKEKLEYRYAVEVARADATWSLSDPIFEDGGTPWRIAEIRQNLADGDTLEILFVRGMASPRANVRTGAFEVRQFTDVCAFGGPVGIGGKDRLVSLEEKR